MTVFTTEPGVWVAPTGDQRQTTPTGGLTKREYFAAMAMAAMIQKGLEMKESFHSDEAVRAADVLIVSLQKTPQELNQEFDSEFET